MILVFETDGGWRGKVVQLFTASKYSHVDIYNPADRTVISSYGDAGVQIRPYVPMADHEFFRIDLTQAETDKAIQFAKDQLGAPYDWGAVLGFAFRTSKWKSKSKWFCSELVAAAMAAAGRPLYNFTASRVTPKMIAEHGMVEPLVDFVIG